MPAQPGPVTSRHVSLETIREAAAVVYEAAVRTPLVRLDLAADDWPAADPPDVFLKLENLQPTGSFKIRGACHAVRNLAPEERAAGVWTVSAGNAAQGVALAARQVGAKASVLVVETAPDTKLKGLERLGARIVKAPYEECWRTVESHTSDRMEGRFIHPFDNDHFISGNGTMALEIATDLPDVDAVVAPLGGGGLLAGLGCGIRALCPGVRVYAAEPATAAPLALSLAARRPCRFDDWKTSFVEGAGGRSVLDSMWPLLEGTVDESIVVSLDAAARAMALVAERAHVIAEGAAGCAVAAALSPAIAARGHRRIVVVLSGGNIDLTRFAEVTGACP